MLLATCTCLRTPPLTWACPVHPGQIMQRVTPSIIQCYYPCSDIQFLVGEERQLFLSHKCLLAARCEVFRAMFAVQKDEEHAAPLVLTDIKPKIFHAIMEFIYGNCCNLANDSVVDIMAASIEYGLDGLTKVNS